MNRYYIYQITESDGTPRYIGKGCGNRCDDHFRIVEKLRKGHTKDRAILFAHWQMAEAIVEGREFTISTFIADLSEADAYAKEEELIAQIGREIIGTGPLWNIRPGGGFDYGSIPFDMRSEISRKRVQTLGPEGYRAAKRKRDETLGPEGRSAAARKRIQTLGAEGCSAAAHKGNKMRGPEGRSAAARKRSQTLGSEGCRAAGRKAARTLGPKKCRARAGKAVATLGPKGLSVRARKIAQNLGPERRSARRRKANETLGPEERSAMAHKAWATKRARVAAAAAYHTSNSLEP